MTRVMQKSRATIWSRAFTAWRFAVSILFVSAVVGKLYNPVPFVATIEWLGVPLGMRAAVLWIVVLVEVSLAGWLLLHQSAVSVWAACSLLALYMLVLTRLAISPAPLPAAALGLSPAVRRASRRLRVWSGMCSSSVRAWLCSGRGRTHEMQE
jgi:uncharacterized membrane protein YphA (DoxX/SURF4 family)